ncbi:protein of unknown function (plasmid) [Caballeronia sp. S22]
MSTYPPGLPPMPSRSARCSRCRMRIGGFRPGSARVNLHRRPCLLRHARLSRQPPTIRDAKTLSEAGSSLPVFYYANFATNGLRQPPLLIVAARALQAQVG